MNLLGTYNGANIISFPSSPGLKQIQIEMNDTATPQISPFTRATQIYAWPGADYWSGSFTLPQMPSDITAVWNAFLGACAGITNVFLLGHPLYRAPRGSAQGTPLVAGVNSAMSTTLLTKGWTANQAGVLLAGDMLQLGPTPATAGAAAVCRLHMLTMDADADGSGNATLSIWPSIRENTVDGEVIILTRPQGLFRLTTNKRSILTTETRLSGISVQFQEAR